MKWLNEDELTFPDYNEAVDGIIALGGGLSVERLKLAYEKGIFPWFNEDEPILWWFPDPRFVLFPDELKVSKSMKKILRDSQFTFTENTCFEEVMRNCQRISRLGQDGTWITDDMLNAYVQLHHLGIARSIEVWKNGELVGGFYGIEGKRIFCGESMFTKVSNASKAGFIYFVEKYKDRYELIDCQTHTEHLESLGAEMISAEEFLDYLD
ncbi:leucyl/phenylalanyl-tRNA--protein transferase [Moheibacter sediminis]|uniref:Leucyl/phenylalanyl-tRNA--protein transferase n=1 Tax=Moheibacter sediminis TaxID=1434700 RepID=A0A1W2AD62_9FLAO|nr:leucyl/phenylalanyl-tRNA--protein transferase [Moheibacter sediminis]SMC58617.1 leucyl/phenylalanyl-tRNA--protein transferase [Moheibacter sediminis]